MAQQLTSTHRAHLRQATDIIEDVVTLPLTPMGREALAHARGLRLGFRGVFLRNFVEREMRFAARGWGKNAPRVEE
jgi:hypothetical protein